MKKFAVFPFCCLVLVSIACNSAKTVAVKEENSNPTTSIKQNFTGGGETNRLHAPVENESSSNRTRSLTGTYEFKAGGRANEIKVLELADGGLKVSFSGTAEFDSQMGPMANSGEIAPTKIRLKGNKAVLAPEGSPGCRIRLVFHAAAGKLEVGQNEDDCGFPGGVLADGSYEKTRGDRPAFEEVFGFAPPPAPEAAPEKQAGNAQDDTAK